MLLRTNPFPDPKSLPLPSPTGSRGAEPNLPRLSSALRQPRVLGQGPAASCAPPAPQAQNGGKSAFSLRDPPRLRRKRTQQSPINYWILFCNIGQIKRCRAPRPCVLWRGESFSSPAGAKHLSALPLAPESRLAGLCPSPGHPHGHRSVRGRRCSRWQGRARS